MKVFINKNFPYLVFLVLHLFFIFFENDRGANLTKPVLLVILIYFFIRNSNPFQKPGYFVLFALLFSLAGDILLIFSNRQTSFFIFGLVSFLLAHLCYIGYFIFCIKRNGPFRFRPLPGIGVVVYAFCLVCFLFPELGKLSLPVLVYAFVISVMLLAAIHAFVSYKSVEAVFCISGAILFILSDSMLSVNQFHTPFPSAHFLIMLSYGFAQLMLVNGIIRNPV